MNAILEAREVNKTFGAVTAAKDINISVTEHEVVGIIGANGAGKTTFVNMVTGWLPPSSGQILFQGRDITGMTPRRITRLGICRSFQVAQVFTTATVFDNLMIALGIAEAHGLSVLRPLRRRDLEERADAILQRYQIVEYRDQVSSTCRRVCANCSTSPWPWWRAPASCCWTSRQVESPSRRNSALWTSSWRR